MTLRLNGSTSGYTEIDAPAVAGSNTLVLPTGNGTDTQVLATNGSGTLTWVDRGRMTLATAQNTTSGTAIDFTGIPSWVKRVTVTFNNVSTSGTSLVIVQLGTSSGFATSGYTSAASISTVNNTASNGLLTSANNIASDSRYGHMIITNPITTSWISSGSIGSAAGNAGCSWGGIVLSGTLDRVRITTVNGTDTFDAGSINILYEG